MIMMITAKGDVYRVAKNGIDSDNENWYDYGNYGGNSNDIC